MATPMKDRLDRVAVDRIAARFSASWADFDAHRFRARATAGLDDLELLDRGRHVAAALAEALPADEAHALRIFVGALGPPAVSEGEAFDYFPYSAWLAANGFGAFDLGMSAQRELTRRFTAEFSLRPWLDRHPERVWPVLAEWAGHDDPHVRRLVSEGTRPRLPWAPRLRRYDPDRAVRLLERLRDDPSPYVRRSVANHLNDIGKDDVGRLVATMKAWVPGAPPERRALLRHALRSLVKAGHPDALAFMGATGTVRATATVPARACIGDVVRIDVDVLNPGDADATAVVDLVVSFVKVRGTGDKVFKGWTGTLAPGATTRFTVRVSLAPMTTRTARPGWHAVALRVDGRTEAAGGFEVV